MRRDYHGEQRTANGERGRKADFIWTFSQSVFTFAVRRSPFAVMLLMLVMPLLWVNAQDSSIIWDKNVEVKRVAKPKRVAARPRPKRETAPLLTLQWRVLKRNPDGTSLETNPTTLFHTGDRLRLAITPNQNGYLYIIHHSQGQDGAIIFPDSRINNGLNFVKKDEEYVLPAYCPTPEFEDPRDCWWRMTPPGGQELFTVIFSRDLITTLPNRVAESGGVVRQEIIKELEINSGQVLKRTSRPDLSPQQGGGAGRYVVWVTNANPKDNEELIETIALTHGT